MAPASTVRSRICRRYVREMRYGTRRKSDEATEETNKQMATIAVDNSGASEARKHVPPHGQSKSDEGNSHDQSRIHC